MSELNTAVLVAPDPIDPAMLRFGRASEYLYANLPEDISWRDEARAIIARIGGSAVGPKLMEIGCGDGRNVADLSVIASLHSFPYTGLEASAKLCAQAWSKSKDIAESHEVSMSRHSFDEKTALEHSSMGLKVVSVVFALGALAAYSPREVSRVIEVVGARTEKGGILYVAGERCDATNNYTVKDFHGDLTLYRHAADDVIDVAYPFFEPLNDDLGTKMIGNQEWYTLSLRKL